MKNKGILTDASKVSLKACIEKLSACWYLAARMQDKITKYI
jgi:hypothetical protein